MMIRTFAFFTAALAMNALVTSPAPAQDATQVGTLTCDVSAGVGMILTQRQTMNCGFSPANGGPVDPYVGRIDQFGIALGAVQQGQLVWGVIAPASGFPRGALAGTYAGVGAQATAGAGVGMGPPGGLVELLAPLWKPMSARPVSGCGLAPWRS